jgi:diguanylate cyclase (GGDEF)-like protein/PAS domain S-box-containing protein
VSTFSAGFSGGGRSHDGNVRYLDSDRLTRQLETFVNNIPNPISYVGTDLKYKYVNDAFLVALGGARRREQVIGRHYTEIRDPETVATFTPYFTRVLGGEICKLEWMPVIEGKGRRWWQTEFYPDFDEARNVIGVYMIATDIHDLKVAHANVHALASTDVLTGLPNRLALSQLIDAEIERHREAKRRCAIIFVDLDGFKEVNDTYGHRFGDSVLVASARRMASAVRQQDTIGRLGGDEFMAIVIDATDEDATRVAQRLVDVVSKPLSVDGREVKLTASVGVAFFPEHGQDLDNLIRAADAAMYCAKGAGKNRIHLGEQKLPR